MTTADVTILGAGPYGLAAHQRQIKGLELRVFGEPMDLRKSHMPEVMSFGTLMFFVGGTDSAPRRLGRFMMATVSRNGSGQISLSPRINHNAEFR